MYFRLLYFNVIINIVLCNHYIVIVFCNWAAVMEQIHHVIILRLFPCPEVVPLNG